MTAIAWRCGSLAADSACWGGDGRNTIVGHHEKIIRLPNGGLFAGCGRSTEADKVARHLAEHDDLQGLEHLKDEYFGAIWIKPDGIAYALEDDLHPMKITAPFAAWGAPVVFMLGALHAGASAEQAVRLAIHHTDGAAGEVQVVRF